MPKAVTISRSEDYHSLALRNVSLAIPNPGEILVKIAAAALNHRDLYIRQNLYPAISFHHPLLADDCGFVLAHSNSEAASQRVIINPGIGWLADPVGPEKEYTVLGGTSTTPLGTLQEMMVVPIGDVEPAPAHLSNEEAAALPLAGLTAWRALVTESGNAEPGRNILITGVGGGVATMALIFAVAKGCRVFVTSSSMEKIAKAKALGAQGGVDYTDEERWATSMKKLLPRERPYLDAVIDGAGGDIVGSTWKLLKLGGVVVNYGMTSLGQPTMPMQAIMKNIELRGTTMGSRREFRDMLSFVGGHRIRPVIARVVHGIGNLNAIDRLFEDMRDGKQFGKLVVNLADQGDEKQARMKSQL